MDIAKEIKQGNKRAAARLISMIENRDPEAEKILRECWDSRTEARVIGITGAPGSGKSTLTDQLAKALIRENRKVGIIAVDPSSPITGGAFLGDRVRMSDLNKEPGVFIRSMGTRGALGGISKAVRGAVRVLEIFGMEYIFIETVGIGQSEVDVAGVSDMVVLVMVPGMGDDIQAEKAGILEMIDVIAVNKADHDGAGQTLQYLRSLLRQNSRGVNSHEDNRENVDKFGIKLVSTIATEGTGIDELLAAVKDHYGQTTDFGEAEERQRNRLKTELSELIQSKLMERFREYDGINRASESSVEMILGTGADPYSEADRILDAWLEWLQSGKNG